MKIGLFGGSFDPIHRGHLAPVEKAASALALDRVVFLPTARPPHKAERVAPSLARYAMVELALLERPDFVVSDLELASDRPSYTVDTIARFREESPGDRFLLLIGADSFAELATWVRWREIVATTELAVLARPGCERDLLLAAAPSELRDADAAGRVHWVENPPVAVSSTAIRMLLARGEPIPADWLPRPVLKFIRKYALYR